MGFQDLPEPEGGGLLPDLGLGCVWAARRSVFLGGPVPKP